MKLTLNPGVAALALALLNCHAAQVGAPRAVTAPAPTLVGETAATGSSMPVVSADGQHVAFVSRSPNLLTNPASGSYQVFLRDLAASNLVRVTATASGTGGNDHSMLPSISSNGLWIAFESEASDLVPGDTNDVSDIFVRDVLGGQTLLVSGGRGPSRNPIISVDGRHVAFESHTPDLVPNDGNNAQDVFVRDLVLGEVTLVSVNMFGSASGNRPSELLTMTPDARFVAFWSDATDISSEAPTTTGEVYVRDMQAGVTYCLTEGIAVIDSRRFKTVLTPDGRYAALQELELTDPSGAVPGAVGQVFRADVLSGSVSNIFPFGRPGRGLAISDDGSRLIFYALGISRTNYFYFRDMSVATNRLLLEVPTDVGSFQVSKDSQNLFFTMAPTNHGFQLFWHSLLTSETTLLTTNAIGEPINGSVLSPFSISESGAVVAFETTADDLVSKDLNRAPDIFVSHVGLLSGRHPDLPEGTGFGVGTLHRGSVNANGRRIAFLSTDSWLILNDTNQMPDLFLYDLGADSAVNIDRLVLSNSPMASLMSANGASIVYEGVNLFLQPASSRGALFRVDLRSGQSQQLGTASSFSGSGLWQPSLSQDGRWLVVQDSGHIRMTDFRTPALPGQANNQIVDVRFDGTQQGNGPSSSPMISVDGDWVVFLGRATDLITLGADGGTGTVYPPSVPQAFARNLRQQRTRLLSITDTGAPLPTGATNPVLSANARYVAFETYSGSKIYRHDLLATGRVTNLLVCSDCSRPSISGDGQLVAYLSQGQVYISLAGGAPQSFPGVSEVTEVTLSIDGRFIAWVSRASGVAQVYLEDRWNGNRHLVSHKYLGTDDGNGPSTRPVFSHDGRTLAFQSFASDLVPGDYNGRRDIFVVEISPVDTDSDGMDDDWETHYFQSLVRDGSGNVDGDHLTDREEFLAGSDPLDSASDLRFTRISSRIVSGPMQDTEVKWTSAPGKTYRVQHAPDLAAPWADLSDDIITGGPTGSATHLDLLHRTGFYRLLLVE